MATIRCQYCHKNIDAADYPAHEAEHLKAHPTDSRASTRRFLPRSAARRSGRRPQGLSPRQVRRCHRHARGDHPQLSQEPLHVHGRPDVLLRLRHPRPLSRMYLGRDRRRLANLHRQAPRRQARDETQGLPGEPGAAGPQCVIACTHRERGIHAAADACNPGLASLARARTRTAWPTAEACPCAGAGPRTSAGR